MAKPRKKQITTRDPQPQNRDPQPAAPAKVIRLTRRRCHWCGGTDFETHDSRENPAGVRVQHCTCRACGAKQIFIFD
jgi:hypothetical protein